MLRSISLPCCVKNSISAASQHALGTGKLRSTSDSGRRPQWSLLLVSPSAAMMWGMLWCSQQSSSVLSAYSPLLARAITSSASACKHALQSASASAPGKAGHIIEDQERPNTSSHGAFLKSNCVLRCMVHKPSGGFLFYRYGSLPGNRGSPGGPAVRNNCQRRPRRHSRASGYSAEAPFPV